MRRTMIFGAVLGAVLGALAELLRWIDAGVADVPPLEVALISLLAGSVWMSIGAATGAVIELTGAKRATPMELASGLAGAVGVAGSIGSVVMTFGFVAQTLLVERASPWAELETFGTVAVASVSAVGAASVGYLTWAVIAWVRHGRT